MFLVLEPPPYVMTFRNHIIQFTIICLYFIFYYKDLVMRVISVHQPPTGDRLTRWHNIITMPTHKECIILLYMSIKHYSERRKSRYYVTLLLLLLFSAIVCTQLYIPLVFRYRPYSVYIYSMTTCSWVCLERGTQGVILHHVSTEYIWIQL